MFSCSYCQKNTHIGRNCPHRPKVGEIWETISKPTVRVCIKAFKTSGWLKVMETECVASQRGHYVQGNTYDFRPSYFARSWEKFEGEWQKVEESVDSGANCSKCKKYYPYADNVADFKCWSCRNGF